MPCFRLYNQRKSFLSSWAASRATLNLLQFVSCSMPHTPRLYATSAELAPRVVRPSIWHSIIPKFLRKPRASAASPKLPKSKEWNPATFYIAIFLLIGSNSIQMITLKNDFANFSRKADARINLLKEIIDRVQRGENVDVEGLLGTGDMEREQEWGSVLSEIEEEDRLWQAKEKRNQRKLVNNDKDAVKSDVKGPSEDSVKILERTAFERGDKVLNNPRPGFY